MTFEDPRRLLTRRRYTAPGRDGDTSGAATPAAEAMSDTDAPTREGSRRAARRIVLTGGPGSGKSTAAAFLAREFVDELWVLPESATLLYRGGLPRAQSDLGQQVAQRAIFTVQRSLEDATLLQHPDRVQLCDRATIDGAAYWPDGDSAFFRAMQTTHARELSRYDAVVFMHTAAMLPAGYERDIEVRTEDRSEAIELDRRIFRLYADHPRVVEIESNASFLDKLISVRNAVASLVAGEEPPRPTPTPSRFASIAGGGAGGVGTVAVPVAAPVSALMGLAAVQHVLPVD